MSTSPIIITPSTSVVLVNTADYAGNPVVLLPNLAGPGALGRIITVRDNDGGSVDPAKSIYLSTTGGARFQAELSTVTLSTISITQPYGFITLTPRLVDASGNTNYGLMNVYAFPEATPAAYVRTFNSDFSYISTLSTVNLLVSQNTMIEGNLTVGGGITYVNPGSNTLNINRINANTISVASLLNSNFYGVNAALSTINTSSFVVRDAGAILMPNASSWSNTASFAGATDPNSLTLGNPVAGAGTQIGLGSRFFGVRAFTQSATGSNYSTVVVLRDRNVAINPASMTNIGIDGNNYSNYRLFVNGAVRLSNEGLGLDNDILLRKQTNSYSSIVEVTEFAGSLGTFHMDSSSNITEGFFGSGSIDNKYKWLSVDKAGSIQFWTGSSTTLDTTSRVTIDNTGRMGVGTNQPTSLVHISTNTALNKPALYVEGTPHVLGLDSLVQFMKGGNSVSDNMNNTGVYNNNAILRLDTSGSVSSWNYLSAVSSGTQRFRLQQDGQMYLGGRFGIETNSPQTSLDVSGGGAIIRGPSGTPIEINTDTNPNVANIEIGKGRAADGNSYIDFISQTGADFNARLYRNSGANASFDIINNGTGNLQLGTSNTTHMVINSNGSVGLGTTSPTANYRMTLNVGSFTGGISLEGTETSRVIDNGRIRGINGSAGTPTYTFLSDENMGMYRAAEDTLAFTTNGTQQMQIDPNGRVSIGTTCNQNTLNVHGSIRQTINNSILYGTATDNTQQGLLNLCSNDNKSYLNYGSGGGFYLRNILGNDRFSVDDNGGYFTQYNTDISNNNPSLRLQNSPGSNLIEFYTNLQVGAYNSITQAGDKGIIFTNGAANTGALVIAPWASGTKGIRIDSAGNVGIGAATPGYTLDVNGKINIQNSDVNRLIFGSDLNNNKISLWGGDTTTTGYFGFGIANNILRYNVNSLNDSHVFYQGDTTELMRIKGNGTVGIGTASPTTQLTLSNSAATNAVSVVNSANSFNVFGSDPTDGAFIGWNNAMPLRFATMSDTVGGGFTERMRIDSAGNVGIGCNAPSVKLDVNGSTKITGNLNVTGTITATGDITAFSDARIKENINPIVNALGKIRELRGVTYTGIGATVKKIGVIAQEIEKILPEVVATDDTPDHYKSVAYGNITALLIEGIKELAAKVDALEGK